MATIVALVIVILVLEVTLFSCISDVRSMRIPNMHSIIIAALFVPAWFLEPKAVFGPLWVHLGGMAIMFIVTYVMFYKGMIGGGDSKLATALGLWVGLKGIVPFMFYMAIMGGVLGAITLLLQKKQLFVNPKPGSWIEQAQAKQSVIPYGIAISFGSWISFFHTGLIPH